MHFIIFHCCSTNKNQQLDIAPCTSQLVYVASNALMYVFLTQQYALFQLCTKLITHAKSLIKLWGVELSLSTS